MFHAEAKRDKSSHELNGGKGPTKNSNSQGQPGSTEPAKKRSASQEAQGQPGTA